jgi:hypothetical protein
VRLVLTFWCPSWTCVVSYSLPQLVIAESNPGLDGHKLAASLCKVPSIGVTLIPDSNIYALMARVNKVSSVANEIFCYRNAVYLVGCAAHHWSHPNVMHLSVLFAISSVSNPRSAVVAGCTTLWYGMT